MPNAIDLSGIDFSDTNQAPAETQAPHAVDLSGIDFSDPTAAMPKAESPDWVTSVGSALSSMPERMQKSWEGIKQGVSLNAVNTQTGTLAAKIQDAVQASNAGVESATKYLADLGVNPAEITATDADDYKTKLAKNQKLYDAVERAKVATLQQDKGFMDSRAKSLKLAGEIAKTAPTDSDQWSAKNLISTIATGAADMLPAVATALIFKSPTAGLAEMTGQAYGSYVQDALDKGLTPQQASNRASLFAALEPVTEAMPLGLIMKKGANKLTDLGKSAIAEGIQEGATQAIQNAYDIGVLNEDMTVGQFLNDVGFNAVTGAGTGGVLHAGLHAPGMVKEALQTRAVNKATGAAAAESGQAVPSIDPAEYDAVRTEMGTDALDKLTEDTVPVITQARRQAYSDARARGLSPAEAMTEARGQDSGADILDQMVADVFDSPDSVYYANKASATSPAPSVAEMVTQQAMQGDVGPLAGETLGLPSPGQTSTIAMPGPVAEVKEPTGYNPRGVFDESPANTDLAQSVNEIFAAPKMEAPALPPKMEAPALPPKAVQPELAQAVSEIFEAPALPPKKALFARAKKATVSEPVLTEEELAAQRAEQDAESARQKDMGESYVAKNENLPPLPGKDGKPKLAPLQVTQQLVKAAKERGVDTGAKVNWNGKEHTVDKLQGRAVRLIDENGNGHIADIQEINAHKSTVEQMDEILSKGRERAIEGGWRNEESSPPLNESTMTNLTENEKEQLHQLRLKAQDEATTPAQAKANIAARIAERKAKKAELGQDQITKNTMQGIVDQINNPKRKLSAIRTDMAAMAEQDKANADMYAPLKGVTRKAMREEIENRRNAEVLSLPNGTTMRVTKDPSVEGFAQVVTSDGVRGGATQAQINRLKEGLKSEDPATHPDVARVIAALDNNKKYAGMSQEERRNAIAKENEATRELQDKERSDRQKADANTKSPMVGTSWLDDNGKHTVVSESKRSPGVFRTDTGMTITQAGIDQSVREQRAQEKRSSAEAGISEYTKDMPNLKRGATMKTLRTQMRYDGKVMARHTRMEQLAEEGATPDEYAGKPIARYKNGSTFSEITKAEHDYLSHLISKKKPSGAASITESKDKPKGMKDTDVAAVATEFVKKFKGVQSVDMSVMQKQDDLGIDIPEGKSLLGFYEPGKISAKLVAENLNSKEEVEALLRHEMIVHYGMRARLSKVEYDAEMDRVLAAEKSLALRKYFAEARAKYDNFYDITSPDGQRMVAEEVVAQVSEDPKALERSSVIKRVLEALRQMLINAKILPNKASMESVRQLIQANGEYLTSTIVDRNDVRVSLPPMAYNAPQDMTASMNKKTDIDDADVPSDIKDDMKRKMYRDIRSLFTRITDMMEDNFSLSGIYQGMFDDLHAIKRYEEMSNNGKLKMGRESAYKFSMLAKNINSVVAVAMNKGAPKYDNGAISVAPGTKGFTEVFKPVLALKGNMLPVWEYWAGAVRAKRLLAEGREQLYTQKQVDDILDYVNRRPEVRKAFNDAHKDWRVLNKAVLDFGEQTGIVDPEARKLFESEDYVPFYRVDEEADKVSGPTGKRGMANQSSGIRRLKGGEGKMDILENMARNVNHIISSGFKNAAMQRVTDVALNEGLKAVPTNFKPVGISNKAIKDALNDMGVATSGMDSKTLAGYSNLFTAVAPAGPNIITVRYDGKPQYFEVTDPQLLRSIAGIGPERLHAILKILAIPKKILTRAVTSTPTFIATNMARDIAGNFAQMSKETGRNTAPKIIQDILTLRPIYRAMRGGYQSLSNAGMATDFQVSGGMSGGYDQSRPEGVAKHLRGLSKRNLIIDTPKKLWELYDKVLTASEQATRMAVYQDVLDHTKDPVEAAYQANDVMNFSRRGDNVLTHVLISTIPFLNARLQGLDRLARGAADSPKAFLLKGAIITAATMALMAMNADDEDYWALPEYERDMFWVIPVNGIRYRIPKPFEIGAVFGTIPERIFEATFRDDHMLWERTKFMLMNTFAVDLPQFMKPMYEDSANINSFTQRPIVPQALQRVQPTEQYATTTPEWIKGMAKSMPEFAPDWMRSPLRLQHMIEGYTGSMGQWLVSTTDAMYRGTFTDKVMPAKRELDYPVVRAFVRTGEVSDKYVDRLYKMSEKAGAAYGTLKAYRDQQKVEEFRKFKAGNESVLAARRQLDKAVAKMQKLNKQTKAIYADDTMTPEAKRAQLDELTVKKNDLSKQMSDKYWNLF